jgi:hypothetical protein
MNKQLKYSFQNISISSSQTATFFIEITGITFFLFKIYIFHLF